MEAALRLPHPNGWSPANGVPASVQSTAHAAHRRGPVLRLFRNHRDDGFGRQQKRGNGCRVLKSRPDPLAGSTRRRDPLTGWDIRLSSVVIASTALSMPRFTAMGLAPAVTFLAPSR
jgi:hypothetical protein